MASWPPQAETGTVDTTDPWLRPAAVLRASAVDVLERLLEDESDAYGQLQALSGLTDACREIARQVKEERVAIIRTLVAEHGVPFTARYLEVDASTIRHMAPQGRWQVAAHPKARERQAVRLYQMGHSVDAVSGLLRMGHRRVKRVVLAAGIELRQTNERSGDEEEHDGE